MQQGSQEKFRELLEQFENGMLVTRAADGALRSRPMSLAKQEPNGNLWFSTELDAAKVDEIQRDPRVNVSFQGDNVFLSISGRAEVVRDRALFRELWNPMWKIWFEGKDDPNGGLIRVEATDGEYWDNSGVQGLKFLFDAAKAIVTGDPQDTSEESPDEHGKVAL